MTATWAVDVRLIWARDRVVMTSVKGRFAQVTLPSDGESRDEFPRVFFGSAFRTNARVLRIGASDLFELGLASVTIEFVKRHDFPILTRFPAMA